MNITAFDLSLTCSGWADESGCGTIVPPASSNRGIVRLRWIRDAVLARAAGASIAVLEGYSFASRGRAIISLGELGGVVRCALADAGLPSVDVAPASRALFATGKGNASKEHVLAEAIRALGYARDVPFPIRPTTGTTGADLTDVIGRLDGTNTRLALIASILESGLTETVSGLDTIAEKTDDLTTATQRAADASRLSRGVL